MADIITEVLIGSSQTLLMLKKPAKNCKELEEIHNSAQ